MGWRDCYGQDTTKSTSELLDIACAGLVTLEAQGSSTGPKERQKKSHGVVSTSSDAVFVDSGAVPL